MIDVHPAAYALRPVRIIGDGIRVYEGTTFPRNPWAGCELWLRRLRLLGHLADDGAGILLDVLDAHGDIVQDFPLTQRGLRYMRELLRSRVAEWETDGRA